MLKIGFDKLHEIVPLKNISNSISLESLNGKPLNNYLNSIFNGLSEKDLTFNELKKVKFFLFFVINKLQAIQDYNSSLLEHDIAHVVGVIAQKRYQINQESVLPPFFEFKEDKFLNDKECLENELYPYIFSKPLGENYVDFLNKEKAEALKWFYSYEGRDSVIVKRKDAYHLLLKSFQSNDFPSFEIFLNFVITDCLYGPTFFENKNSFESLKIKGELFVSYEEFIQDYERLFNEIVKNPPQIFVDMLKFIYENRNDKKVFVKLFFKYCDDFINKLE